MRKKVYKIQRKHDSLFSTGGCPPKFTDGGKVWGRRNEVLLHLENVSNACKAYWPYDKCELISYGIELRSRANLTRRKNETFIVQGKFQSS